MKIEILSIALVDIQSGQHFYEQQQEGLGVSFWICWFSTLMLFMLYAGIHQQFFGYYRARSKRFPYAIYYRVSDKLFKYGASWTVGRSHRVSQMRYALSYRYFPRALLINWRGE